MTERRSLNDFVSIFYLTDKKELYRHCRSICITTTAFTDFIVASEYRNLPWLHKIHFSDHVPEHLIPSEEEHNALSENGPGKLEGKAKKLARKIYQTFEERRYLVGHMFFTPDLKNWHFFYFDQRDWAQTKNHWKHGCHIHLINYLWPNYDAQSLWNQFTAGNVKLRDSVHIRFDREEDGREERKKRTGRKHATEGEVHEDSP